MVNPGVGRLLKSRALVLTLALGATGGLLLLPFKLRTRWNQLDFSAFYVWAVALRQGLNPYVDRLDTLAKNLGMNVGPFDLANYPPLFLICFLPLSHLSAPAAYAVWMSLQYVSLAGMLYLLIGSDRSLTVASRASIASFAVLFSRCTTISAMARFSSWCCLVCLWFIASAPVAPTRWRACCFHFLRC